MQRGPRARAMLLVEECPSPAIERGLTYTFHAPLNRAACEALARATAARLGRRFGRDLALQAADLGWSIRLPEGRGARRRRRSRCCLSLDGLERRRARGAGPGRAAAPSGSGTSRPRA